MIVSEQEIYSLGLTSVKYLVIVSEITEPAILTMQL